MLIKSWEIDGIDDMLRGRWKGTPGLPRRQETAALRQLRPPEAFTSHLRRRAHVLGATTIEYAMLAQNLAEGAFMEQSGLCCSGCGVRSSAAETERR